jgi:hypothetical protein
MNSRNSPSYPVARRVLLLEPMLINQFIIISLITNSLYSICTQLRILMGIIMQYNLHSNKVFIHKQNLNVEKLRNQEEYSKYALLPFRLMLAITNCRTNYRI